MDLLSRIFDWLREQEAGFSAVAAILVIAGVVFAGVADVDRLWVFANIAVAVVAIPNLVAMLCLSGVFVTLMRDEISGTREYATAKMDGTDVALRGFGASKP